MKLRPCIDIHNGKVKQIVGSSLKDFGDYAADNFVSDADAGYYASLYKNLDLPGGHIIILNSRDSKYYEEDLRQAKLALSSYPGGMMIGGGIVPSNAGFFLDMGATHVIVTSYVFKGGLMNEVRLKEMLSAVGKHRLVLDLSCRKKGGDYYIVTDRWQKFTDIKLNTETLKKLSESCSEFLIHAVDTEGKRLGIDTDLAGLLSSFTDCPVTYAGGISSLEDIQLLKEISGGSLDITIGSALDIFGGNIKLMEAADFLKNPSV